jgi:trimethylamine--corrinoid protein Co-methyltransferase
MQTMVDCYAAPEHFLALQAGCDMARYYGLPSFSYAAVSDAKLLDEQCAAEYGLTTILGALSRATLLHDVGYLESGLQGSFETILLGAELIGWVRGFTREIALDSESLATAETIAVGPGGNHLTRRYTRQHHAQSWRAALLDQVPHDRWAAAGAKSLQQRLRETVAQLREESRSFTLPPGASTKLANVLSAYAAREE